MRPMAASKPVVQSKPAVQSIHAASANIIEIIDPHVHLFALEHGQYHWLKSDNPPYWPDKALINKSFTADSLHLSEPLTLRGYVHIEAGFDNQQPCAELAYLEKHFSIPPFNTIAGCDLTLPSEEFATQINSLTEYASCVGVRHILDDQALSLLACPRVLANLSYLDAQGLLFEAQFDVTDTQVVDRIWHLFMHDSSSNTEPLPLTHTWVINHVGLGSMNESSVCQWQQNLARLAAIPSIKVKASGWEMADREYNFAQVKQTLSILLEVFGDKRVLLASNFPLTLFSCSYQTYWENIVIALQELTESYALNSTTQRALLLQNALDTYFPR